MKKVAIKIEVMRPEVAPIKGGTGGPLKSICRDYTHFQVGAVSQYQYETRRKSMACSLWNFSF
jgi:hypothetical protein